MSSRAEEKERRRQERLAREQEAQRAAARKRTLQMGAGAILGLAVIAVVAVVVLAGGGSKSDTVDTTKLAADAKAAGCTFSSFKSEGRTHTAGSVTYKTNPPTSGNHNPTPAQDGFYRTGNTPPKENLVHSLEHGRIEFQYKPGTPAADAKLRRLAEEPINGTKGYHVLMFENTTKMPEQFAAAGWTKSIACPAL